MLKFIMAQQRFKIFLVIVFSFSFSACSIAPKTKAKVRPALQKDRPQYVDLSYRWLSKNVFGLCFYCHASRSPNFMRYESTMSVVVPGKPLESVLYQKVARGEMPKGGTLSNRDIAAIYFWILEGAEK